MYGLLLCGCEVTQESSKHSHETGLAPPTPPIRYPPHCATSCQYTIRRNIAEMNLNTIFDGFDGD
jgi:hypothetical protein